MRLRALALYTFLGAVLWVVLIVCIALIVSLVGWLGFILGVAAFVALALVIGSILGEAGGKDDLGVPGWVSRR
ncbi:MAG: hypothetical protein M3P18_13710 [Actinomycetota bacterium]|nr:hypothetical protein [Actinomycetota bacterium]